MFMLAKVKVFWRKAEYPREGGYSACSADF
jgi:hypothetical protein